MRLWAESSRLDRGYRGSHASILKRMRRHRESGSEDCVAAADVLQLRQQAEMLRMCFDMITMWDSQQVNVTVTVLGCRLSVDCAAQEVVALPKKG